ncbi:MAG: filamentous hemagglutinin N-terminal domain-containing protein, partial [Deltaproteobacteria bacterium]|nr:filamentous hemagglutinin N-terminal domain-containing protein [Deltaproteobacteria bacterium]
MRISILSGLVAAQVFVSSTAFALPTDPKVVAGQATVGQSAPASMQIQQGTQNAIINWGGFGIAGNESVVFQQPSASSVVLNRVIGASPSDIFGRLTANGQIFLVNPNGIFFARGAQVETGGLVASTLGISNESFMSGRYTFQKDGAAGSVVNAGTITTLSGYAALIGPQVANSGVINARLGTAALAAGDRVTLDMVGDGLINVHVDQAAVNASALNSGTIIADGGNVLMTARSANALLDTVVNTTGVIRANTMTERGGSIIIDGGDKGVVSVSGTLQASGQRAGEKGGTVKVLGEYVGLFDNAKINASGDAGGGTVLIGGNFQGKGPEHNAFRTYVGPNASIHADAVTNGDGGKVVVWSNDTTRYYGSISVRGGAQSGDGGFVEISGKHNLAFDGKVDTTAPHGKAGSLLLDPDNITIVVDTTGANDAQVGATDGTVAFADGGTTSFTISETALEGVGSGTNILLQANVDITVNAGLTGGLTLAQTAGQSVQFSAGNNVTISSPMSTQGGSITLSANHATGTTPSGTGKVVLNSAGSLTSNGGNITLTNNASSSAIDLGANVNAGGGTVSFQNAVNLTADVAVTGNGAVTFVGAVNGAQALTVNSSGVTTFSGGVGGTAALSSLTTDSGGTTAINGGLVSTTGAQTYNDAVTLGANA